MAQAPSAALDRIARAVWQALGAGEITEPEAAAASEVVEARRKALKGPAGGTRIFNPHAAQWASPRRCGPISPQSLSRRRRQAASGALPPELAAELTQGEQAVLAVVGREAARAGRCDWPVARIAALAGVGRSTTKLALRIAQRLGMLRITERRQTAARSLPNLLTITGKSWLRWLRRGLRGGGVGKATATSTRMLRGSSKGLSRSVSEGCTVPGTHPRTEAPPG